jgi:type VI secretion system protein ImpH
MAAESWNAGIALVKTLPTTDVPQEFQSIITMLQNEPFRVQFFQAVRMLHRIERHRRPVGYFVPPEGETVLFSSLPTLTFPPSQLYSLERSKEGQYKLTVQFMGVCCSISVLPPPYTEHLLALMRDKNTAMAQFFDLFNHRMISFFYRGWEKYRFFIAYERGGEDSVSPRLLDLLGLGAGSLASKIGIPDTACLNYVGLLGRHTRPAESLRRILEDYFGVPVVIHQFVGTWRRLPLENQTSFTGFGGASELLGVGVIAGDEVLDQHGRIRISLGPMKFEKYLEFLPGQEANRQLKAWLKFYSNGNYETEVQLILHREEAPSCELGTLGQKRPRLGLVSWLKTKPLKQDPADATYLIQ